MWHVDDRRPVASAPTAHAPSGGILSVTTLPDGRVVSHGRDGGLHTWRLTTDPPALHPLLTIDTGAHGFCGAAVVAGTGAAALGRGGDRAAPPSAVAATAGADATSLALWCLDTGACLGVAEQPPAAKSRGMACAAVFVEGGGGSPNSPPRLVVGFEDGSLTLWSLDSPPFTLLASVRMHGDAVMAVACVGASTIAAAGADATLSFARLPSPTTLAPGPALKLPAAGVAALATRHDNSLLAVACWDGAVRLVGVEGGTPIPLAQLTHHDRAVAAVAFDGGSGLLASGGRDGLIALWRVDEAAGG